jgi:5'-nucleotidase
MLQDLMYMQDNQSIRPLILITNDDSITAPGIHSLAEIAVQFGDVIVAAPATAQSGQSSALGVEKPLRITEHADYCGARMFSITGSPVDCVKLALNAICPRKPDLLLSGINHGSNSGNAIIYSGTMGAVIEGCTVGIQSIGFSLCSHSMQADFSLSKDIMAEIIRQTMAHPLPHHIALNVNIPAKITPKGVRVCRAAAGHWSEEYARYVDPNGKPFYWLTGRFVNEEADATDTDEYWLSQGYASVVPIDIDQTAKALISPLAKSYDS